MSEGLIAFNGLLDPPTPPASKGVTCYQTTTDENSIYIEVEKDA